MREPFSFYVKEFGCKVNQCDSNMIKIRMIRMGKRLSDLAEADVVIVNTCSVTGRASREGLRYALKTKEKYPKKEVVAVGCSTRHMEEAFNEKGITTVQGFKYLDNPADNIDEFKGHTRAFLRIQQGCRGGCTYCLVKYVKTPYYVKSVEDVIAEASLLLNNHPELVLCATNFSEYEDLCDLVKAMGRMGASAGIPFRWRFSSMPVGCLSEDMLLFLEKDGSFCRHFHLPVQSGSNSVLSGMGRKYTREQILSVIAKAKDILGDGVAFSLDIMVGFPGETPEKFRETLSLIEAIDPVRVHLFRYSERKGTPASRFPERIPERVRKRRLDIAKDLADRCAVNNVLRRIGTVGELLLEDGGMGYTRSYILAHMKGKVTGRIFEKVVFSGFRGKSLLAEPYDGRY